MLLKEIEKNLKSTKNKYISNNGNYGAQQVATIKKLNSLLIKISTRKKARKKRASSYETDQPKQI